MIEASQHSYGDGTKRLVKGCRQKKKKLHNCDIWGINIG